MVIITQNTEGTLRFIVIETRPTSLIVPLIKQKKDGHVNMSI